MMTKSMYASGLPTIKCSDCGADIEISMMGDHICTGDPVLPEPTIPNTNHDRIPLPAFPPPFASPVNTQDGPMLSEKSFVRDTAVSQRPIPPIPDSLPYKPETTDSSTTFSTGRIQEEFKNFSPKPGSTYHTPKRTATDPIPTIVRPPSEDLKLPQDSAFPVFPTKKGLSRPNAPARIGSDNVNLLRREKMGDTAPLSPSLNGGAHVLKRMHTITPGPFGARTRRTDANFSPPVPAARREGSVSSSNGVPPTTSSPPVRPPRPETDDSLLEKLQNLSPSYIPGSVSTNVPIPPVPPLDMSKLSTHDTRPEEEPPQLQLPQEVAEPKLSEVAEEPPENEKPMLQDVSYTSEPESLQPLPDFSPLHSTTNRQTGHASTSSQSSYGSRSGFGSRTESSRSSHSSPISLHESRDFHQKTLSVDQNNSPLEQSPRPSINHQLSAPIFKDSLILSSPAINGSFPGRESPTNAHPRRPSFATSPMSLDKPGIPEMPKTVEPIATTNPAKPLRAPTPKSKGICRGCEQHIYGKSVKAADGRLTGRYHRECFVCHTCKQAFETSEFYVHNNLPYCAHHYHVLNGSLCQKCNTGIEGKYLETQPSQKYHVDCFSCYDCRKPLTTDYYELNSRFYCKADAFRAYEKSRLLSPGSGKRFPERRLTRLMMM